MREVLVTLTRRYAFREVAFLVGDGSADSELGRRDAALVQQLCAYGQRLFELDAEDFANPNALEIADTDRRAILAAPDVEVPDHLVERGRLCRMRQSPKERPRAALVDLRPAYRLLLEVIAARWLRHEMSPLVAAVHIAAEYTPLLAWQPILGHAGDPLELAQDPAFTGPESRWGRADDRACPHTRPQKSATARSLRVAEEPPSGWRAYLDRQHSAVSHAMSVCAATCADPCSVISTRSLDHRSQLREACQLARAYGECGLVRLRHAAPVGHGFGVPSQEEVQQAWERSRLSIAKRGGLGPAGLAEDGFPLPGLASLFSAIASAPIAPDTLLADTAAEIVAVVRPRSAS